MRLPPPCPGPWIATRLTLASVCVATVALFMPRTVCAEPLQVGDKQHYYHLLRFVTIPAKDLPKNVRIKEKIDSTPIIPLRRNPEVFVDPEAFRLIAKFFSVEDSELERVRASVVAIYQQIEPANEVGVYGLYFSDQMSADQHRSKLLKTSREPLKNKTAFPFIQKGELLLYIWKDDGVSDQAYKGMLEYFKTKKLKLLDP